MSLISAGRRAPGAGHRARTGGPRLPAEVSPRGAPGAAPPTDEQSQRPRGSLRPGGRPSHRRSTPTRRPPRRCSLAGSRPSRQGATTRTRPRQRTPRAATPPVTRKQPPARARRWRANSVPRWGASSGSPLSAPAQPRPKCGSASDARAIRGSKRGLQVDWLALVGVGHLYAVPDPVTACVSFWEALTRSRRSCDTHVWTERADRTDQPLGAVVGTTGRGQQRRRAETGQYWAHLAR